MEHIYTFTSHKAQAPKQGNLAVEPRPSPSSDPLVLDGNSMVRPLTSALGMKIKALILPLHFSFVNFHLPQLVVELISLGEAVSRRDAPEVCYRPNIFVGIALEDLFWSLISKKDLFLKFCKIGPLFSN
jgi:hypothetical protein